MDKSPIRRSLDSDSLESLLLNTERADPDLCGRILIIEDLTSKVVETLGYALKIDPLFFANHMDTNEINIATPRPSVVTLPSTTLSHNFLNLHYHRVIEFEGTRSMETLLRDMNLRRKVKVLPQTHGVNLGLVRHCCSVLETIGRDGVRLGSWTPNI